MTADSNTDSDDRTFVITGGNSGIGLTTAVALARRGGRVVICCRDQTRGRAAVDEIAAAAGAGTVELAELDLASFESIETCAAELDGRFGEIDVLINNAGLIHDEFSTTEEGFELTFGVNHLGHFHLTSLVAPAIKRARAPRVINLASLAHLWAPRGVDPHKMNAPGSYHAWLNYGRSKLANIQFTQELARRWRADGVAVNAVHPGSVNTRFGKDGDLSGVMAVLMHATPFVLVSPEEGAATSVFLATAPAGRRLTGQYWSKSRLARPAPWANRPEAAAALWDISEEYVRNRHP